MTINLEDLITQANARAGKPKRGTALKHRVQIHYTAVVGGRTVNRCATIFLTDEGIEQYAVVQYLQLFKISFHHVPNERKTSPQDGLMLKALGLIPGVSDLVITATPPYLPCKKGVVIEMKSATGKPTPDQVAWQEQAKADGFIAAICHSGNEAINFLERFGYGQRRRTA